MPDIGLPVLAAILALGLGGLLKGATGAGVPIIAVPVIALYYDVQTAVVTLLLPSIFANVLQTWRYRAHLGDSGFTGRFALFGTVGVVGGTVMLATIAPRILLLMVATVVLLYVGFRLLRPGWRLPLALARRVAPGVGAVAGMLQGATGVSAPVSITFLNATGLPRPSFIAAISVFFVVITAVQALALSAYGALTPRGLWLSAGALAVILATMPLGEALARRVSPRVFDRLILVLLVGVALRILVGAAL